MIPTLTSSYRDWGFIALGFSGGVLIELMLALASRHSMATALFTHGAWGMAVGPLVIWSLLLRRTIPHRIVLALGAVALVMYVVGAVR